MRDYFLLLRLSRLVRYMQVRNDLTQQFGAQGSLDPPRAIETWIMFAGMLTGMLSLFFFSFIGMAVGGGVFLVGFLIAVLRAITS